MFCMHYSHFWSERRGRTCVHNGAVFAGAVAFLLRDCVVAEEVEDSFADHNLVRACGVALPITVPEDGKSN
jgi:hypothetical protein